MPDNDRRVASEPRERARKCQKTTDARVGHAPADEPGAGVVGGGELGGGELGGGELGGGELGGGVVRVTGGADDFVLAGGCEAVCRGLALLPTVAGCWATVGEGLAFATACGLTPLWEEGVGLGSDSLVVVNG